MDNRYKILIIGGGAGGLELATRLGNTVGKKNLAKISLIDQNLGYTWKPLWHEISAKSRETFHDEISYITHGNLHHFEFHLGRLIRLNKQERYITISEVRNNGIIILPERDLHYDILILAIGSVHNSFRLASVENYAMFLDSIDECRQFSNKFLQQLIKVYENKESEIDVAIIGAGSTGIELAFELESTISNFLNYKNDLSKKNIKINLNIIESKDRVLSSLSEEISERCAQQLQARGIKIYTQEKVHKMDENFVYTESGTRVKATLKLWTAGIKCPEILKTLGLKTNNQNQLLIKNTLQVINNSKIFAIGDCSNFTNGNLTATAKLAHQQAQFLSRSINKIVRNKKKLSNFKFKDYGVIVSTIQNKAIGEINFDNKHKLPLKGKLAYFSYKLLYRKYQLALHGLFRTCLLILSDLCGEPARHRVKFH